MTTVTDNNDTATTTNDTTALQWGIHTDDREHLEGCLAAIGNGCSVLEDGGWLPSVHKVDTIGSSEHVERLTALIKEHETLVEGAWKAHYGVKGLYGQARPPVWVVNIGPLKTVRRKVGSALLVSWGLFDAPLDSEAVEALEDEVLELRASELLVKVTNLVTEWEERGEVPFSSHWSYRRGMPAILSWETLDLATRALIDVSKERGLHLVLMDQLERSYSGLLDN